MYVRTSNHKNWQFRWKTQMFVGKILCKFLTSLWTLLCSFFMLVFVFDTKWACPYPAVYNHLVLQKSHIPGESDFASYCDKRLTNFLANCTCEHKYFSAKHLSKARTKSPSYFHEISFNPCQRIFVRWNLKENIVFVSGWKDEVEFKIKEISQHIEQLVSQYAISLILFCFLLIY